MSFKERISKIYHMINDFRYKKFISSFSNPQDNEKRIAKDLKGLKEFDFVDSDKTELAGVKKKRFVMLDNRYFIDYINSVKNRNSYYYSYLQNEDIVSGLIPQNFSVLIKKMKRSMVDREVIASKILNFFEIETTANISIIDNSDFDFKFLASLDFLKHDEEFYSFLDIDCNNYFSKNAEIAEVEKFINLALKKFIKSHFVKNSTKEIIDIKEKILYSYFVRHFVIGDCDLHADNFGIIYDKRLKKISFVPNFDFDGAFMHHKYCKSSLIYLRDNYPNLFNKFVKLYDEFKKIDNNETKMFFESFYDEIKEDIYYELFINRMKNNIWAIDKALNDMQKEKVYQ